MPRLTFISKFNIIGKQILSANEIRTQYLHGINLEKNGVTLPDEVINNYVQTAQVMLEDMLHIKLNRTLINESRDFNGSDFMSWNFQKWSYPINCVGILTGYIGTVKQVTYPKSWLSTRTTADAKVGSRLLYLVPNQNSQQNEQLIYSGIMPNLSTYGTQKQIPNYWMFSYITGFKEIPLDIKMFIGKFTAMNILVMANSFLQKVPGQASSSISLDGLSQSTSLSIQQGIFSSTIKQYMQELKDEKDRLFDLYAAISMITA